MKICAVLVRPKYPSNIGAAARALANLGGERLIVIGRQCEVNSKAKQGAAGAQFKLKERTEYADWDEFYNTEGKGIRIGLTRRSGKTRITENLKTTISQLQSDDPELNQKHIYLVFGPEDNGLDAEDLKYMNYCCHLPVYGEFNSLNLAQAALLSLYIVADVLEVSEADAGSDTPLAEPLSFPEETLKTWLQAMGFQVDARKASALITVRKLLLQNNPTERELMVLESILNQNIRKLKGEE